MKAFLFHSIPCRRRKGKHWNWGPWHSEPGILHTYLSTAFQPPLLGSRGKHAYMAQPRPSSRFGGLCQPIKRPVKEVLGARNIHCQRSVTFAGRICPQPGHLTAHLTKVAAGYDGCHEKHFHSPDRDYFLAFDQWRNNYACVVKWQWLWRRH